MFNYMILKIKCVFLLFLSLFVFGSPCFARTLMVDQGHGQAFLIENNGPLDLSDLAEIFTDQGFELKVNATNPFQDTSFAGIDALVISGPFLPLTGDETNSIIQFINDGGKLCLMLHIPSPASTLLKKLGVAVSFTPINERENLLGTNIKDFSVVSLQPHPITEGLQSFKVYGIWGVMSDNDYSSVIASASSKSWVDMNKNNTLDEGDGVYPYGLVVTGNIGKGSFVVFGDDAIFQNQFINAENKQLAINLAKWLQQH